MAEKPIIFSGPMVRAILDRRKTQTRRVVNHIPALGSPEDWCHKHGHAQFAAVAGDYRRFCPYGAPGSYLWVMETWRLGESPYDCGDTSVHYRADLDECAGGPWKPSIHMPRWASRITLRITDVRVERVQDADAYDAKAEGCSTHPGSRDKQQTWEDEVLEEFAAMWDSLNSQRDGCSWIDNPWCWVISFEVVR